MISETTIAMYLQSEDIDYIPQYGFDMAKNGGSGRRWKADFYITKAYGVNIKLLLEYEGAIWTMGRHTRGLGYSNDTEKYNFAQLMGFVVLRYTSESLKNGFDIIKEDIKKYIESL